jgi:hypothetical protein
LLLAKWIRFRPRVGKSVFPAAFGVAPHGRLEATAWLGVFPAAFGVAPHGRLEATAWLGTSLNGHMAART